MTPEAAFCVWFGGFLAAVGEQGLTPEQTKAIAKELDKITKPKLAVQAPVLNGQRTPQNLPTPRPKQNKTPLEAMQDEIQGRI